MTSHITLFTGGCRSGKSRLALQYAEAQSMKKHVFVATCNPQDREMHERVARHRRERGSHWRTVEAPLTLPHAIESAGAGDTVVLADCLTLWISNLLLQRNDPEDVLLGVQDLVERLSRVQGPVVLVTNEVGGGIVPENSLARLYRDQVGFANQAVAGAARRVVWSVAGIPVTVKDGGNFTLAGENR